MGGGEPSTDAGQEAVVAQWVVGLEGLAEGHREEISSPMSLRAPLCNFVSRLILPQ